MKVIHQGGGHSVRCDGVVHVTTTVVPCAGGGLRLETFVASRCFCNDPEFKAHGFSYELRDRYAMTETWPPAWMGW